MTSSVKCGFGWQRKESLYLSNSKRLHATAPRGENAKLACHGLVEMSFPCVWRRGSIFSCKKISSFAISMAPALLFVFFSATHCCCWISFFLGGDEGVSSGGGGLFLFPESTRHRSRAPYLISREENPSPQLLLIRVKWSQPTNSYRTLKKLLLPLPVSLSLSLCLSLHLSHSVLNLGFGVKPGRRSVAWGHDSSRCCCLRRPRRPRSPLNWSWWKCVGQTAVGIDSCVPSGETGLDTYHNTLMGLCSLRFLAGSPEESGTVQ